MEKWDAFFNLGEKKNLKRLPPAKTHDENDMLPAFPKMPTYKRKWFPGVRLSRPLYSCRCYKNTMQLNIQTEFSPGGSC